MESVMTSNIDTRRLDARRLKKLIEEDRKKDVFEFGGYICENGKIYDNNAEWVKEQLLKAAPTPKN
jgi:hypothetical protein